jgi:hypothetical protein
MAVKTFVRLDRMTWAAPLVSNSRLILREHSQQTLVKNDAKESHMIQNLPSAFAELSCYGAVRREYDITAYHLRVMTDSLMSMVSGDRQTSSSRMPDYD